MNFKLLVDKPANPEHPDQEVDFGHEEVAGALTKLVENAPTPHTIGLFGGWGTGKSTIIDRLESNLGAEAVFIYYDVWRYQTESTRRSFLLDVANQLKEQNILSGRKYKVMFSNLYVDKQESKSHFSLKKASAALPLVLVVFLGVTFFQYFQLYIQNGYAAPLMDIQNLYILINAGILSAITFLAKWLSPSIFMKEVFLSRQKYTSPEEFNTGFTELLSLGKLKNKKIVITIDNLDRVQAKTAIEFLGVLKTFLSTDKSKDNIVFIIACDDLVIKRYLEPENKQADPGESLFSKFFNTTIRLPAFVPIELKDFIEKSIVKTEISTLNNDITKGLISFSFRNSPREIKQFINSLVAYYVLAIERTDDSELTKGFIDKNLPFITELLIIREKFPNEYRFIEESSLKRANPWSKVRELLLETQAERDTECIRLVEAFQIPPSVDDASVFLSLRLTKEDLALPGWEQFKQSLLGFDVENIDAYFTTHKSNPSLYKMIKDLGDRLADDEVRRSIMFRTLMKYVELHPDINLEPLKATLNYFYSGLPTKQDFGGFFEEIAINDVLVMVYPILSTPARRNFRNNLLVVLSNEDCSLSPQLLTYIAKNPRKFSSSKVVITKLLAERYSDVKSIKIFTDVDDAEFIDEKVKEAFISHLDTKPSMEFLLNYVNIFEKMELESVDVNSVLSKFSEIISADEILTDHEARLLFVRIVNFYVDHHSHKFEADKFNMEQLSAVGSKVCTWYSEISEDNWPARAQYLSLLSSLTRINNLPALTEIDDRFRNFIHGAPYESGFDSLDNKTLQVISERFITELLQNIPRDIRIATICTPYISQSNITVLIDALLGAGRDIGDANIKTKFFDEAYSLIKKQLAEGKITKESELITKLVDILIGLKPLHPEIVTAIAKKRGVFSTSQRNSMKA